MNFESLYEQSLLYSTYRQFGGNERLWRSYIWGLETWPRAGFRGRAPGQGDLVTKPPQKLKAFRYTIVYLTFARYEVFMQN